MKTPIMDTERILLRPLTVKDAEDVYRNWTSDPEVARFMNWKLHRCVEDTREWMRCEEEELFGDYSYDWGFVLKDTGELFGSGGLNYNQNYGMFELGYNLMVKYWNRGFATKAGRRILRFAAEELHLKSVMARHVKQNSASGKVLEKLGFIYQREEKDVDFKGEPRVCKVYLMNFRKDTWKNDALDPLNRDQLIELINIYSKNWLALDGVWFQSVERKCGMEEAMYHDREAWKRFTVIEAMRIKKFLQLPDNSGLEGLKKALKLRFYANLNRDEIRIEGNTLTYWVRECRVQRARERKGMAYHPCKSVGIVEYEEFAKVIDERFSCECISCYPDIRDSTCCCAWRFTLKEEFN